MEEIRTKDIYLFLIAAAILALFLLASSLPSSNTERVLASDIAKALESCKELTTKEQCYAKYFEQLTEVTNRDHAFATLRALQQVDPESRGCHFIAHAISTAETEKDPSQWRELMNTAPSDCSYGAAHGALEVYASTFPNGELPESEIPTLCDNPDRNNCTHALGHLLLVLKKDSIPESLAVCDALPHDAHGKFECITGVFMERITAVNLEIHGLAGMEALNWPARVPELEVLCRAQTGIHSVGCWKEIAHAVIAKVNNDTQQLVNFCETAPGEAETRECVDHSIGIIAAANNFDFMRNKSMCDVTVKAADYKERCYSGLISSTLSTIPTEVAAANTFCASLEARYQGSCFSMIQNVEAGRRMMTGD